MLLDPAAVTCLSCWLLAEQRFCVNVINDELQGASEAESDGRLWNKGGRKGTDCSANISFLISSTNTVTLI